MNVDRRSFLQTGAALAARQFVKAAPSERVTLYPTRHGTQIEEIKRDPRIPKVD